jgi:hypothetical protein
MAGLQFIITPRNKGKSLAETSKFFKQVRFEINTSARGMMTNTALPVAQSVIISNTSGRSAHNDPNGLAQNLKIQRVYNKKELVAYKLGVSKAWQNANEPDALLHIEYGYRPHFIKIRGNKSFQQWAIYQGFIVSEGKILRYRRSGGKSWFVASKYWPVGYAGGKPAADWPPHGLRFMERAFAETANISNKELEQLKNKIIKKWRK